VTDDAELTRQPELPAEPPILALTKTVVFPREATTLQVRSRRNRTLVESIDDHDPLVLVPVPENDADALSPDQLGKVGVAARMISHLYVDGGGMSITVEALQRVRVISVDAVDPFFRGRVVPAVEEGGNRLENNQLIFEILELYERLVDLDPRYAKGVFDILKMNLDEPGEFADLAAKLGYYPRDQKQRVLETLQVTDRLRRVRDLLRADLESAEVASEVKRRTDEKIERERREYYLRQQLREIQKELGAHRSPSSEADRMLEQARAEEYPDAVVGAVEREADRLRAIEPSSPEYDGIRNYVRWLLDLPWTCSEGGEIDLERVQRELDRNHYGLDRVKERILEHLAVMQLTGRSEGTVLCFVGPPGTGKTSLGRAIASAIGRKFLRLSVGGVSDEAQIRGHRRTYVGSMPGKILQGLAGLGCHDPVLMIDEIDKMGRGRGDPEAALLEVLDPEQNHGFVDHYLGLPFDLSGVLFICTANVLSGISRPLLDRMEVIRFSGYTEEEKVAIATRYLAPAAAEKTGLGESAPRLARSTWVRLIREYTREAGLRELRRKTETILRKVATAGLLERKIPRSISARSLPRFLGPPPWVPERSRPDAEVGVATGLAWTSTGGDLLTIETLRIRGEGKLIVTGRLGDVLRESVEAAHSYVRSRAEVLQIDPEVFRRFDLHVHFPDNAVPKDGPSAGVTVTMALASLLSRRPVRADVAMTGEITLRGHVLPIGGVKEKVLAARRSGISTVILPRGNEKDLADVPAEVRRQMRFHLVDTMDEVLEAGILTVVLPEEGSVDAPGVSGSSSGSFTNGGDSASR